MFFTIDQETNRKGHYLVICICVKEGGRIVYKRDLEPKYSLLVSEELRFLGMTSLSSQADTAALNRIRVSKEKVVDILKLLGSSGLLFWKGKKLFVDPFSSVDFYLEVAAGKARGKWKHAGGEGFLDEAEWVFKGEPPCLIVNGSLYFFKKDISSRKIAKNYSIEELYEEYEDDPFVVWKEKPQAPESVDPSPFLVLKDRSGAFADLWMEYGLKQVARHDPVKASWRSEKAEAFWEKDLLETGFLKKVVENSHYYCPLDQVVKSLTFLLEMGWKLIDCQGRRVMRQQEASYDVALRGDRLLVQGKISYEAHVANASDLLGAFQRRERFLSLTADSVGLIDEGKMEDGLKDLAGEEIVKEGISLEKRKWGLLEPLFSVGQKIPLICEKEINPLTSRFNGSLHSYQQEGMEWLIHLYQNGLHALLADGMGLGKTVQTLAFLSRLELSSPVLIVAPTSLVFNWRKEIEQFLPTLPVYVHAGFARLSSKEELKGQKVILTSYALLRQGKELLSSLDYGAVIIDEAQNIKNPESQAAQAVFALQAAFRLAITGTPIENRWEDLWSLFHFLMPGLLGERKEFQAKMAAAAIDSRYLSRLKRLVRPFLLRRTKDVIADQLPPKSSHIVWVEMSEPQRALYEEWIAKNRTGLLKKIKQDGGGAHRMEILEAILRLRQICCHPVLADPSCTEKGGKLERLLLDLEEVVAEGRKALVYSQFTQMLRLIEKEVQQRGFSYVLLDGSTKNRQQVVETFQEDLSTSIFLISLKAGGVGLNLTAADDVFLFDPWWNNAVEEQAIDRAHRLGRKNAVMARRYLTPFSIEEKMLRLKEHKSALAQGLFSDDDAFAHLSLEELIVLLE